MGGSGCQTGTTAKLAPQPGTRRVGFGLVPSGKGECRARAEQGFGLSPGLIWLSPGLSSVLSPQPVAKGAFLRGSGLNVATGRFTAPVGGIYQFSANIHIGECCPREPKPPRDPQRTPGEFPDIPEVLPLMVSDRSSF